MSSQRTSDIRSVLIVAPHADDEVIGTGGLIASLSEAHTRVFVAYVAVDASGHYGLAQATTLAERRSEIAEVARILQFEYAVMYEGRGMLERLDTIPQRELVDAFEALVDAHAPDLLLLPHGDDYDQDHRAIFQAALAATRPIPENCGKFFARRVATYESPKLAYMPNPFKPHVYREITGTLETKLAALRAYQTQLRQPPHVRSVENLTALARLRGSEFGVPFAEAFHVLRWSID
jgi:LmbE family N-acetylglucosaminyl deacetylase